MNFPKVKKVLINVLLLNWLVALAKIFIGISTGSLSILTNGLHSLFDGASNILGLIGIKIAEQPRDSVHPYGHRKFETLAAFGIAFLVLITIYEVLKETIIRFLHPVFPEITTLSFIVLFITLIINIFIFYYENHQGKKLKSQILIADSLHTKSDVFVTFGIILGMFFIKTGFPILDLIITLFLVLALGKLAWEIVRESITTLCDQALVDAKQIQKIASTIDDIISSHQIRTRGDKSYVFLDMHISLKPDLPLKKAHQVSHLLKQKIIKSIPQIKDVIIHIEPRAKRCQCK